MSERNWIKGFAFGVVVGFLLTPALVFTAILLGAAPDDLSYATSQANNAEQIDPQDNRWWLVSRVVYMDDTAAQWIMTFATIFAAYLLLRTLWATQRMAEDTREIGKAQTRSYLSMDVSTIGARPPARGSPAEIDGCNIIVEANISIKNTGQSPAFFPRISYSFSIVEAGRHGAVEDLFPETRTHDATAYTIPSGAPKETTTLKRAFECDLEGFKRGDFVLMVFFQISYKDVFGDDITAPAMIGRTTFEEVISDSPKIFWSGVKARYRD